MTDHDFAQQAADEAVKKVFAILGVNVDEPREVEEFRQNLRFGATLRRAADRGVFAIIGIAAVGMAAAFWSGVIASVRGH